MNENYLTDTIMALDLMCCHLALLLSSSHRHCTVNSGHQHRGSVTIWSLLHNGDLLNLFTLSEPNES
ncbi:hypothetical protein GJAV_G00047620 [Gymnothorax javanicus]|nr:hypothetical protein GJAV_G00047620 [Gymnothorax javanicus]